MRTKNSKRKMKNYFLAFLILNFIFCIFSYTAFAQKQDKSERETELIVLDYKDAELSSVLRALSYTYDLNIVTTKDIKGKVTISLTDVTIDEALDAILKVNGYSFSKEGKIIYIFPGPGPENWGLETVSINLKYLIASEAETLLQESLSSKGKIRVNEATNSLIITDYPQMLGRIKEVIEVIDVQPIQVLIESKIVDITSKDLQNIGISLTAGYKGGTGTYDMSGPSTSLSGGQFTVSAFPLYKTDWDFGGTIDALVENQKAHLLASPSIATLNGKEARIIIGEKYPFKEKTQTTTGTTETTKFVEIGTTLRVTPQVSPDGYITLQVHPEVSSVSDSLDAGPRITTREADATIRVKDGQTIIIGGLIKTQKDKTVGRVPILGYIPIVNWFFTNRSKDSVQTELVVFITPHIIRNPEEAELAKAAGQSEVYIDIEKGEHLLVSQRWEEARNLEKGEGVESRRKDKEMRMSEALDLYKQIAFQFPGNPKADNALYKAGLISYDFFADLELSRSIFSRLVERYPDSPYAAKSRRMVIHIDKKTKAKQPSLPKKERKDFKAQLR